MKRDEKADGESILFWVLHDSSLADGSYSGSGSRGGNTETSYGEQSSSGRGNLGGDS